nr:hypothetical protein Gp1_00077 [Serratia proteamaculans]
MKYIGRYKAEKCQPMAGLVRSKLKGRKLSPFPFFLGFVTTGGLSTKNRFLDARQRMQATTDM